MPIKENTLVLLYSLEDHKKFFITLKPGTIFSTHMGIIKHDDLLQKDLGDKVETHKQKEFLLLKPSLYEILMNISRHSQIIYPKEIGYILIKLGLKNGDRVIEAGTGSGALTTAMGYAVAPEGKIYTYEKREEFQKKAESNLIYANIKDSVEMKVRDVEEQGFDEKYVDAVFLDMKVPFHAIGHAFDALRPGGMLGFLLPTANQVSDVIRKLSEYQFVEIEALEILLRHYK